MLLVVSSEYLEVGVTVSEELFDVIVGPGEGFRFVHEDGLDVAG